MTYLKDVLGALKAWPSPRELGDAVVVPTTTLYPGGGIVNVHVVGRDSLFVVHDDANGVRDFENCGGEVDASSRVVASLAKARGLYANREGRIFAQDVDQLGLASAIAIVADTSRHASEHLLARWAPKARRKFKDVVENWISVEFPNRWVREAIIPGRSDKRHRFDFVVEIGHARRLAIDAVVPDTNAISTAVVRHLDVAGRRDDSIKQTILYDDRLPWKSSDLKVLGIGSRPVAFSQAEDAFSQLYH